MAVLLEAKSLFCERDDRLLINDLTFTVYEGELCQVEGPNGSGKTSLLRVICGLSSRYQGELCWRGKAVKRCRYDFLSQVLYLGHQSGIKAVLTPRENLQWHSAVKGQLCDDTIEKALYKVGLLGFEDSPCYSLSAGQQRRVALARLFIRNTPLWILDEPFTAIDKKGVAQLETWISEHIDTGGSVLLTTHHELSVNHPVKKVVLGG